MRAASWISVVEQSPAERTFVIVGRTSPNESIFAGWLSVSHDGSPRWWTFDVNRGLTNIGQLQSTDLWMPLPEWVT